MNRIPLVDLIDRACVMLDQLSPEEREAALAVLRDSGSAAELLVLDCYQARVERLNHEQERAMKIDKANYREVLGKEPSQYDVMPLTFAQSRHARGFPRDSRPDHHELVSEWWVIEAEEVVDAMARDVDVLRMSTWPAFNSGPAAMRAPTSAFASAWERTDR